MKTASNFINAVLGGVCVSIGGIVYLSIDNKYLGAFLFTVGLFTIYTMGLSLYTGKVCHVCEEKPAYLKLVGLVWVGNLVGTTLTGFIVHFTRIAPHLEEKAAATVATKLGDGPLSVFILAILCNIMIYMASEEYVANPHELGKYLGMIFGVMVFILAGFEHCIANMFYFTVGGGWGLKGVLYLLIATAGNAVGGNLIPLAKLFQKKALAAK